MDHRPAGSRPASVPEVHQTSNVKKYTQNRKSAVSCSLARAVVLTGLCIELFIGTTVIATLAFVTPALAASPDVVISQEQTRVSDFQLTPQPPDSGSVITNGDSHCCE